MKIENHGNQNHGNQNHGNHIVGAIPGGKFVVNDKPKRRSFDKSVITLNSRGTTASGGSSGGSSPFQRAGISLVAQT
eukprot:CAMPEP_0119053280 /NCGR_PEP_ID=MMETSP1177-20130426/74331_1 /TAXON_ID=2985 /ORGANISM="Ochromonas sp, Strain CCMP1899" /LENGTH=76 /DNA_ID=CAMNT_0007033197 /DNA_START=756 /DNA_END=986 /DNA_ORIENTATION=-